MLNSEAISLHALPNELVLWIVVMVLKSLQMFCLMLISRTKKLTVIGLVSNGKQVVCFIWLVVLVPYHLLPRSSAQQNRNKKRVHFCVKLCFLCGMPASDGNSTCKCSNPKFNGSLSLSIWSVNRDYHPTTSKTIQTYPFGAKCLY